MAINTRAESPDHLYSPAQMQPPWRPPRRSNSSASGGRQSIYSTQRATSFRDDVINNAEKIRRRVTKSFMKLSLLQKILVVLGFLVVNTLLILFLVYNERIFGWLEPKAEAWKNTTGGWIVLWIAIFFVALPPMIGYSTCATIAGFVYGLWEGWLILATATVAGSTFSFLVSRTFLRRYVERLVGEDKRFAALTLTLKHDGLKLLCMIRLCPLPYSIANGAMSTVPSVHPVNFALATAIASPKLLVHAFIGSRLAAIAKSGGQMSAGTKAINYGSAAVSGLIGVAVGWYIYQKTIKRARELELEEADHARSAAARGNMPPREFSDDPEAQAAALTLAQGAEDEEDEEDDDIVDDDLDYFVDEDPNPHHGLPQSERT